MNNSLDSFYEKLQFDLSISAPILFDLVELHPCKYYNGKSFDWYHKAWQFLRILDKVSTPTWHSYFYFEALKEEIKDQSNILISGTADYTIIAFIIEISKKLKVSPKITVIDICSAPLKICEWYCKKEGFKIKTKKFDILNEEVTLKNTYDIIISDAFLTRFEDNEKKLVLNFWKNVLKKRGVIITTVRVDESSPYVKILESEKNKFVEEVVKKFDDLNFKYDIDIKNLALNYISNIKSFSYKSSDRLISDINEFDFEIKKFDDAIVKGEAKKTFYKRIVLGKGF